MKTILLLLTPFVICGCPTISGDFGYVDPKSGASVGFHVGEGSSGKSVRKVKASPMIPVPGQSIAKH